MRKVQDFKLASGDDVKLIEKDDYRYIRDKESGCTITSNRHFGYIQNCYDHLLKEHKIYEKSPCIIHLGTGFGYDLLYADRQLRHKSDEYRIIGVDLSDYHNFRPASDEFNKEVEFHSIDAMKYLLSVKPQDFRVGHLPQRTVVVLIDLFLTGNAPISLVYENSFWEKIVEKIDPDHIVVNRCGGDLTFPVAQGVIGLHTYKKTYNLEFYARSRESR